MFDYLAELGLHLAEAPQAALLKGLGTAPWEFEELYRFDRTTEAIPMTGYALEIQEAHDRLIEESGPSYTPGTPDGEFRKSFMSKAGRNFHNHQARMHFSTGGGLSWTLDLDGEDPKWMEDSWVEYPHWIGEDCSRESEQTPWPNDRFFWATRGQIWSLPRLRYEGGLTYEESSGLIELDMDELVRQAAVMAVELEEARARSLAKKNRQKALRAVDQSSAAIPARREAIPASTKMFVWQRDRGRCVECGSRQKLEFDHIIPIALGGSNTERNLQLLCEAHNRSKGVRIG